MTLILLGIVILYVLLTVILVTRLRNSAKEELRRSSSGYGSALQAPYHPKLLRNIANGTSKIQLFALGTNILLGITMLDLMMLYILGLLQLIVDVEPINEIYNGFLFEVRLIVPLILFVLALNVLSTILWSWSTKYAVSEEYSFLSGTQSKLLLFERKVGWFIWMATIAVSLIAGIFALSLMNHATDENKASNFRQLDR